MVDQQQTKVFQTNPHGLDRDAEHRCELPGDRLERVDVGIEGLLEHVAQDHADRLHPSADRPARPVLLGDVGVDERLKTAEAIRPRVEHALPGHQKTGREVVGLPFNRLLLLAGSADHRWLGIAVGEHGDLAPRVCQILAVKSPVANFVADAEVVTPLHIRVLRRLQALVDEDFALVGPERTEHIREAQDGLQVVEVEGQAEVQFQDVLGGHGDLNGLAQLVKIGSQQCLSVSLDLLLGKELHVDRHFICIRLSCP